MSTYQPGWPTTRPITTLLIANRGEIARRIIRTARAMGIRTVAVYSEPDRSALHVREADSSVALGGYTSAESYLRIDAILEAAKKCNADAIHPGYGFLSENASFAAAVVNAGLIFVGPTAANIESMGGKIEAKRLASLAQVPTLPSAEIHGSEDAGWLAAAAEVGYPLLVKASAGGGGKGMRIVNDSSDLVEAIVGARREAESSFGNATVFVERYLRAPRHIEIQIFADVHGNVIHLNERECSVQRRHQKIIEEAPSSVVSPELRERMGRAATELATSIGYVGAGTMEFLLDDSSGKPEFFFLEMNTRLQVEHPVTECVTGTDLVRWQLMVAQGESLPLRQDEVELRGSAIEVRLYAEDPANDFLPTFGDLHEYAHVTPGLASTADVRFDDGIERGSVVSTFYDPMLGKVIAHAPTRVEAAARLRQALTNMSIHGVTTNRNYLVAVLGDSDFLTGSTTTAYVAEHQSLLAAQLGDSITRTHIIAATLVGSLQRRRCDLRWSFAKPGWRNLESQFLKITYRSNTDTIARVAYRWLDASNRFEICFDDTTSVGQVLRIAPVDSHTDSLVVEIDGVATSVTVRVIGAETWVNSSWGQSELVELPRFPLAIADLAAHGPTAPVPGRVVAVQCAASDIVEAGQTLVIMEAMKMEHRIEAAVASTVIEVLCKEGDQVDAHQVLVTLEPVEPKAEQ
jgi:propionyl-CoA carboxylase alpha chain